MPNIVGVFIKDAPSNQIGGTAPGAGNQVSANTSAGVYILDTQAQRNAVQGNQIGTDAQGRLSLPNLNGVYIDNAPGNLIGGPTAAARNLISGNSQVGVYIFGESATGNRIQGNWIGSQANGKSILGNGLYGILLYNAPNNTVDKSRKAGNRIVGSGLGPIREFTGGVPTGPIKHATRTPARHHAAGTAKPSHTVAKAKRRA